MLFFTVNIVCILHGPLHCLFIHSMICHIPEPTPISSDSYPLICMMTSFYPKCLAMSKRSFTNEIDDIDPDRSFVPVSTITRSGSAGRAANKVKTSRICAPPLPTKSLKWWRGDRSFSLGMLWSSGNVSHGDKAVANDQCPSRRHVTFGRDGPSSKLATIKHTNLDVNIRVMCRGYNCRPQAS